MPIYSGMAAYGSNDTKALNTLREEVASLKRQMETHSVPDSVLGSATITREQSMAIGGPRL